MKGFHQKINFEEKKFDKFFHQFFQFFEILSPCDKFL